MSLISKQIGELRAYAKDRKGELAKLITDAADTIEMLSAKLHASQMARSSQYYHGGWIPCSERLPEEGERVLATHLGGLNPDRQVIEHIYKNGKFTCGWEMDTDVHSPTFGQRFMGEVIAWMPWPECYREGEE